MLNDKKSKEEIIKMKSSYEKQIKELKNKLKEIASENFLRNFARLASKKSKLNEKDQKNVLFLIQKWALKYKNKFPAFDHIYQKVKSDAKNIPNSKIKTYTNFISEEQIKQTKKAIDSEQKRKRNN